MAHRIAKIVVPIGAMNAVAAVKIHHVRHIGQVIAWPSHIIIEQFDPDVVSAGDSWRVGQTSGNEKGTHQGFAFKGVKHLLAEVNVDPFIAKRFRCSRVVIRFGFFRLVNIRGDLHRRHRRFRRRCRCRGSGGWRGSIGGGRSWRGGRGIGGRSCVGRCQARFERYGFSLNQQELGARGGLGTDDPDGIQAEQKCRY